MLFLVFPRIPRIVFPRIPKSLRDRKCSPFRSMTSRFRHTRLLKVRNALNDIRMTLNT